MSELQVQVLDPRATIPDQKLNANGYDLYPLESHKIRPGETVWVDTGIAAAPPEGHYIRVAMRSGYSGKGLIAGAGVVDWNYRGPLKVCVHCVSQKSVKLSPDTAFAQFVVERCANPPIRVVESLDETERGDRGFGSTDDQPPQAEQPEVQQPIQRPRVLKHTQRSTDLTDDEKYNINLLNNKYDLFKY